MKKFLLIMIMFLSLVGFNAVANDFDLLKGEWFETTLMSEPGTEGLIIAFYEDDWTQKARFRLIQSDQQGNLIFDADTEIFEGEIFAYDGLIQIEFSRVYDKNYEFKRSINTTLMYEYYLERDGGYLFLEMFNNSEYLLMVKAE